MLMHSLDVFYCVPNPSKHIFSQEKQLEQNANCTNSQKFRIIMIINPDSENLFVCFLS